MKKPLWILIVAAALAAGCWGTKKGTSGTNVGPGVDPGPNDPYGTGPSTPAR